MIRTGHRVASGDVKRLSHARRMSVWDLIQRADSTTARVLAQELPLEEQLRASVQRERKPVMTEPQPAAPIATVHPTAAALAPVLPEDKYQLLRDTYARGSTQQEFDLFVAVCNRLRLDPFARQIYAVKRYDNQLKRDVMTPQVSIDGMRLAAERTGKYAGQGSPEWCAADGAWKDVWLSDKPPVAARVAVYRKDFTQPIVAVALFREYAQYKTGGDLTRFWANMPANQIAKCAESLALRKAFPNELSGVYSVDEMGQADSNGPAVVDAPPRAAVAATTTTTSSGTTAAPVSKPAANGGKEPAPESKQEGPRFALSFQNKQWSGKPMAGAPAEIVRDYIAFCEGVLGDRSRERLHKNAKVGMQQAEAVYDKIVAAEMDRVRAAANEEVTTEIGVDAINAAMDAEYARTHGGPNDDGDDLPY